LESWEDNLQLEKNYIPKSETDKLLANYDEKIAGLKTDQEVGDLDAQLKFVQKNSEIFARYKEEICKGNLKKCPYSFYYQNDIF